MVQKNRNPDRDSVEAEYASPNKRSKSAGNQWNSDFNVPDSGQILLEKLPLGLKLRKSPSLIDLIEKRLNQSRKTPNPSSEPPKSSSTTTENKPKAANFAASVLRIGNWEFRSRYEGDLVVKFYFAKQKMVFEVLENGLKNKIEIDWSDIAAINADLPDNAPGTINIVVSRKPQFFKEAKPQPKMHSLWKSASDFTYGQASLHRKHSLQCPEGVLNKHFEKLLQCDARLRLLSQQKPEMTVSEKIEDFNASECMVSEVRNLAMPDSPRPGESEGRIQNLASSAPIIEIADSPNSDIWNQIMVPGLQKSISVSDFLNEIEEQVVSGNLSSENKSDCQVMLEGIAEYLLDDAGFAAADEKLLMTRVNSLCCLLQKDDNEESKNHSPYELNESNAEGHVVSGSETARLSRKDSFVELLFNLPRITSLPKILSDISEDGGRT